MHPRTTVDLRAMPPLAVAGMRSRITGTEADRPSLRDLVRSVPRRFGLMRAGMWLLPQVGRTPNLTADREKAWQVVSLDEAIDQRGVLKAAFGITTEVRVINPSHPLFDE